MQETHAATAASVGHGRSSALPATGLSPACRRAIGRVLPGSASAEWFSRADLLRAARVLASDAGFSGRDFSRALIELPLVVEGVVFGSPAWRLPTESLKDSVERALSGSPWSDALLGTDALSLEAVSAASRHALKARGARLGTGGAAVSVDDLSEISGADLTSVPNMGPLRVDRLVHDLVVSACVQSSPIVDSEGPSAPITSSGRREVEPVDSLEFKLLYLSDGPWQTYLAARGTNPAEAADTHSTQFRNLQIARLRMNGASLASVGNSLSPPLTRERIRVVVRDVARSLPEVVADALLHPRAHVSPIYVNLCLQAAEEVIRHPGVRREVLAASLGVEERDVNSLLGPQGRKFVLRTRRSKSNDQRRWSDEQIISAIQRAAVLEFPLTGAAYDELVDVGELDAPKLLTVFHRFGSWHAACAQAGVVAGIRRTSRVYEKKWHLDELAMMIAEFLLDWTMLSSVQAYGKWASLRRAKGDEAPSEAHLRNTFGTWPDVVIAGQQWTAEMGTLEMHEELCREIRSESARCALVARRGPLPRVRPVEKAAVYG